MNNSIGANRTWLDELFPFLRETDYANYFVCFCDAAVAMATARMAAALTIPNDFRTRMTNLLGGPNRMTTISRLDLFPAPATFYLPAPAQLSVRAGAQVLDKLPGIGR